jgi:predicted cupin superfamily sugar epimerase
MAPQVVVPRGVWQGAALAPGGAWALLGTTVAPGFAFDDC